MAQAQNRDKCNQYEKIENLESKNRFKLKPRQDLCIHRFDEYSVTNGILLLHNVGSGKTITSLTLAINSIDFTQDNPAPDYDNNRFLGNRTILLVHPTGLLDEFMKELQTKILNIQRVVVEGNNEQLTGTPDICKTDPETGVRRYKFKKIVERKNQAGNWQNIPNNPVFYIESIQYNELASFFSKYDQSILKIRKIFYNRIVIIDEAHRLFRQFDICDKSSMIISKYINDNLMGGAKKIIAMTGTPLKNNISDMLTLIKFINTANVTNLNQNGPLYLQKEYQRFDITNRNTYKEFIKLRKKSVDPNLVNGMYVMYKRAAMAASEYLRGERSDLSVQNPDYTNTFIQNCAKLDFEAEKKQQIRTGFAYLKYWTLDIFGCGTEAIPIIYGEERNRINQFLAQQPAPRQQPGGGMIGGNINSLSEAAKILEINENASKQEFSKKYKELALKFHPDRCRPDQKKECEKKFKEIAEAYSFMLKNIEMLNVDASEEDVKIIDYYNKVVNSVIIDTLMGWSNEEIIQFSKHINYIIKNTNLDDVSTYDLLVEFSVQNPYDYMDLLSYSFDNLKNCSQEDIIYITSNYENSDKTFFRQYFNMDYELFNNLYVSKTPVKLIEDIENLDVKGEEIPQEYDEEEEEEEEDIEEQLLNEKKGFFGRWLGLGGKKNKFSNGDLLYGDFDTPNEITLSILLNKIKNNKNESELQNIIGPFSPESIQTISKNLPEIEKNANKINEPLQYLIKEFSLMIENKPTQKQITQKGGVFGLTIVTGFGLQVALDVLGRFGITIPRFVDFLKGITEGHAFMSSLVDFIDITYNFIFNLPIIIGETIYKVATLDIKGLSSIATSLFKVIDTLIKIIHELPGSETVFQILKNLIPILTAWRYYILTLLSIWMAGKAFNWYFYNTTISALDKNSWLKSMSKQIKSALRKVSKTFSFYKSLPDDIALLNISKKEGYLRKRDRLKQELYRNNAFFDYDYEKIVELTNPIISTITVTMPIIDSNKYLYLLNTNLYTIERIYNENRAFLFDNNIVNNYPEKQTYIINIKYDYFQYYSYNQFSKMLSQLSDVKHMDYINYFIPWYLNKKILLDTKLLGNLSKDTSYPLNAFDDTTRSIVYYDLNTQGDYPYKLNISDGKIRANGLKTEINRIEYPIYKPVGDITFECLKFRKILNNLILMKTGYMVDLNDNFFRIIPQAHLSNVPINKNNIDKPGETGNLYNDVHTISPASSQYFLPFVYSTSDELGLNLFAYFLEKNGYKYKVLHELTPNESVTKDETIRKSYPIINLENNQAQKDMLSNFVNNNIINTLNDKRFEEQFSQQLKSEPICVLLHPFKTEGIDAKFNPAIFLMEPALNFGDYEQLCGRVLRSYSTSYPTKPKKMVYQCLCSSVEALDKFYNNYVYLQPGVQLVDEDLFSIDDFFYTQNDVTILDPNSATGENLKTGWFGRLSPSIVSLSLEKIKTTIPFITSIAGLITQPIASAVTSVVPPLKGKTVKINGLVPNKSLEYALFPSVYNEVYNYKNDITPQNSIDVNLLNYIDESIKNFDTVLNDLIEGVDFDNDEYLKSSKGKVNYNFYSLLDDFVVKAQNSLEIHKQTSFVYSSLRTQLERSFNNTNGDYFEQLSNRTLGLENRFLAFQELSRKCTMYEYSKLIIKDIQKYMESFKELSNNVYQQSYNISILLEISKLLNIIPDIDDFDKVFVDIGSDIYDFLSIKRTEYMFKNNLIKRYESNDPQGIPDLVNTIKTVNEIQDENLKMKVKLMPWCNTITKRKYDRCFTTSQLFSNPANINYSQQLLDEITNKSNEIVAAILSNNINEAALNTLKEDLDNFYSNNDVIENVQQENQDGGSIINKSKNKSSIVKNKYSIKKNKLNNKNKTRKH
jgi:prefoldin subunit 5